MPVISKKVYLTPDVFYAFLDRTHAKHDQAAAFFRYFAQNQYQLFTDSISLHSAYNLIFVEMSHSIAKDFLRTIYLSNVTILYPDESTLRSAIKLILTDISNELTLDKAVMGVLADKKGISQICTLEYMRTMFGLSIFYIPL